MGNTIWPQVSPLLTYLLSSHDHSITERVITHRVAFPQHCFGLLKCQPPPSGGFLKLGVLFWRDPHNKDLVNAGIHYVGIVYMSL